MLPDSSTFKDTTKWPKFADLAIPKVAEEIAGENTNDLVAKIAGGPVFLNLILQTKACKLENEILRWLKDT